MSDALQRKINQRKKQIERRRRRFKDPPIPGYRTGLRSQTQSSSSSSEAEPAEDEDSHVSSHDTSEGRVQTMDTNLKTEEKSYDAADAVNVNEQYKMTDYGGATTSSTVRSSTQHKPAERYEDISQTIEQAFQSMCDRLLRQHEDLAVAVRAVSTRLSTIESKTPVVLPEVIHGQSNASVSSKGSTTQPSQTSSSGSAEEN